MSKLKGRLAKRAMALILSGAMLLSDAALSGLTVYAAEDTANGYYEESSESLEPEAEELTVKETQNSDMQNADEEIIADAAQEDAADDDMAQEDDADKAKDVDADEAVTKEAEENVDKENGTDSDAAADDTVSETEDSDEKQTDEEIADGESAVETPSLEEVKEDEETTDEEVTEEAVDNQAGGSMTFKSTNDKLTAGIKYGDDILEVYVLEDMGYKASSGSYDGTSYTGHVVGTTNPYVGISDTPNENGEYKGILPSDTTGWIPDRGAVFKIKAIKASTIAFVIAKAGTETSRKTYYFVKDDGETGEVVDTAEVPLNATSACTLDLDAGQTYYFYVSGSKVSVYEIKWEDRKVPIDESTRTPWEEVADPVISNVSIDETDKSKINVTVNGVVGLNGADRMTVSMYDSTDKMITSNVSATEGDTTTFAFSPTASGSYKFQAEMVRDTQETKKTSAMSEAIEFVCPLTAPVISSTESLGGGKIQIKWSAVPEVDKYVVEVVDHQEITPVESTTTSASVSGLKTGTTYSFTVYAVRGTENSEKSAPVSCKAEDVKITYTTARYGNGIDTSNNKSTKLSDDSVRLVSKGGKGKVVPASTDGLMFYYTTVPSSKNFTFTAMAHVNSWTFSNGQEGFGVMAADRVGKDGTGGEFWNNSYQAVVSRVSYKWNGIEISDDSGEKIEMQIGVGSTEKVGVTPDDLTDMSAGDITVPRNFSAVQSAIDSTFAKYGAGQYNIVANCTNPPMGSDHEQYQNFELQVRKNNTGYLVSYTKVDDDGNYILDSDGNKITTTKKYFDPSALSKLTKGSVYVGVFTARNADVTFSNMRLETIDPEDDDPAEEKAVTYYNLSTSILSQTVSNSEEYEFIFHSNWNGTLVLKNSKGDVLAESKVTGSLDPEKQALQDGFNEKNTKVYIDLKDKNKLSVGKNVFTVEYTPDKDWCPDEDKEKGKRYAELNSYDKVTLVHTVEYRKYGEPGQTIYVSQYGKSTNPGTKENPLDIYTAVKYAQPGQTILLAGGTYSLNRTLQTPRGIDGKPDIVDGKETYKNYIKMMAEDPENRPVLDFMSLVPAVVTVGNYWYFKNFDVIRCKDGEKGIQVSSSNCVFDRVDTYKNGSTGLQISRLASQDTFQDWPHDNLILNCNSYLNVDEGYEDADGFAAKLTSGSNNVFDGCIAAFNADDGWDLFAKVQTGSIGAVTIKNSLAYRNGYVFLSDTNDSSSIDENGTLVKGKGNGNGFKMGGDGVVGGSIYDNPPNSGHKLENSYAFCNKMKGFDSNSCPNVKAYNSVSFNNGGTNIGFSTASKNKDTDYEVKNVISFRTDGGSTADSISGKGSQSSSKTKNSTSYLWNGSSSKNSDGKSITADDFVSLDYKAWDKIDPDYWRNADGSINMHGFLQLKEGSTVSAQPSMGGTASNDITPGEDTYGNITGAIESGSSTADYGEDYPEGGISHTSGHYGKLWAADIKYIDYTDREPIYYTGKAITPELHVRFSADVALLTKGKDYSVKYENNINAGTATAHIIGAGSYTGFTVDVNFEILPIDLNDNTVSIPSSVAVVSGDASAAIKPTWRGKALKKGVDYTIEEDPTNENQYIVKGGRDEQVQEEGKEEPVTKHIGNFSGQKIVKKYTVTADKLMSKANVTITEKDISYTGSEVKPAYEVKMNGSPITEGFTVEYANNIEVGKATLTVVGDGVNYFGSKSVNFAIKGGKISDTNIVMVDRGAFLTKYQDEGVKFSGGDLSIPENTIKLTLTKDPNVRLKNGYDYKIVQSGTNKAGTATITIKGINGYTGALTYKYKITALNINEIPEENIEYYPSLVYRVGGATYDVGVNFNIRLNGYNLDQKHFILNYKNNSMVGNATDGKAAPTVVIVGKGGLTGKKEIPFTITPAEMTGNADIVVSAKDIATNGKDLMYADLKKTSINVTQSYLVNGKTRTRKLTAGRDYDKKTIEYYIDRNDNYVIDEGVDELVDITKKEVIAGFKEKGYLTVLVRVRSANDNPKCSYVEGYVDGYFRAALYDINKAKVINKKSRVYGMNWKDGNGLSVSIDWSDTEVAKIEDYLDIRLKTLENDSEEETTETPSTEENAEDKALDAKLGKKLECVDRIGAYKMNISNAAECYAKDGFVIDTDSYSKNNKVGTATFTIVGTGKFAGTKKVTFKIVSKDTAKKMIEKGRGNEVEAIKVEAIKVDAAK